MNLVKPVVIGCHRMSSVFQQRLALSSTRSFNGCVERDGFSVDIFQDLIHPVGDVTNHPTGGERPDVIQQSLQEGGSHDET